MGLAISPVKPTRRCARWPFSTPSSPYRDDLAGNICRGPVHGRCVWEARMASNVAGIGAAGAQAGGYEIRADVLTGIQQASANTGVDFSYLMAQAAKESSFNPDAKSKSSSAAGLYQFVEQ